MRKKSPLFLLTITVSSIFLSCSQDEIFTNVEKEWLQKQDSIRVAIFPYYPPYQFINERGDIDGIFIEYLELLEQKTGHEFHKKQYTDWPKVIEDVQNNKIDIIVEIQKTKDRKSYLDFYGLYFKSRHILVTRKNTSYGDRIGDFKEKTITLPKGYAITENVQKKYPNLNIVTNANDLECLQKLNSGEYHAYIGPKAVVNYLIKTKNLKNLEIVSETNYTYKPGIGVNKKNEILNEIISKATSSITRKEKQFIFDNWLFNIVKPFYQRSIFWIVFSLIILSSLIIILFLNRYLNFKIKKKTKELLIAKEIAEESDRLKTNFIRNISHEIRTPMNGIIGFSKFLADPNLTEEERQKYTLIITNSGKQLISIIEDILEISKLRTKQVKVKIKKTNLNILFSSMFSIFEIRSKEKGIDLYLENKIPEDQCLVLIDKSKLKKILHNLIDNAFKFTKEGFVKISCKIESPLIIISIEDTGIGINAKDQEIIFSSFSQSEKEISKNYGGLGLGLTIAKENAMLIGGQISFISEESKGTTFTLTLPHNPIQSNIIRTTFDTKNKSQELKKHIILIAEDGEVNFLFLKTVLIKMQDYDFMVHRAKDGKEAVNLCENNDNIDLVLMDIKMPVMDGYDATRIIKKVKPKLPIVAQTAYSTEEDIKKAIDAGCDDFISKPVDQKLLKPILKKYFSPKKLKQKR